MISAIPSQVILAAFWAALLAHLVQLAYYWPRLPSSVAIHYDIEGEPSSYWPKSLLIAFWVAIVATLACVFYLTHQGQSLALGVVIILFLLAVMQLLINANLRGGRLSMIGLILVVAGFLALMQAMNEK
jgi:uncharacterized membrane protein